MDTYPFKKEFIWSDEIKNKVFTKPKLINLGKVEEITEEVGMENVFTDVLFYGLFASLSGL